MGTSGDKFKVEPEYYYLTEDEAGNVKLYLNFSKNVQNKFLKNPDDYIQTADKNWRQLNKYFEH